MKWDASWDQTTPWSAIPQDQSETKNMEPAMLFIQIPVQIQQSLPHCLQVMNKCCYWAKDTSWPPSVQAGIIMGPEQWPSLSFTCIAKTKEMGIKAPWNHLGKGSPSRVMSYSNYVAAIPMCLRQLLPKTLPSETFFPGKRPERKQGRLNSEAPSVKSRKGKQDEMKVSDGKKHFWIRSTESESKERWKL